MISNRKKAFETPSKNPATKFIEWKSNEKCFSYYDKEKAENVTIPLPFSFLVLEEMHKVSGWNDANQCRIFSNEVKYISTDIMSVRPFKGAEIANGFYKDIKEDVKKAGGRYERSIYIMLEDGSLANIALKGSSVQQWGEFTQKSRSRLTDEWVLVADAIDSKKGSVKFSTPNFKFNGSLSNSESDMADEAFNTLEAYLKTYLVKKEHNLVLTNEEEDLDF